MFNHKPHICDIQFDVVANDLNHRIVIKTRTTPPSKHISFTSTMRSPESNFWMNRARRVRLNKKKKSTNISPYPDEVIDRLARAFYPAILACWNSEEGQRSLVGAKPLHLANARPFGRLKAPLGLSLLRCAAQTRACLWQAEQAHLAKNEKQEVPSGGELPAVHIVLVCGFWQGASGRAHPVFILSILH